MLAMFHIAHQRNRINILLLDEALDTLDLTGLQSVAALLTDIAQELGLTVFVTSHTELNSQLHEAIVLEKKNGIANLKS